MSLDLSIKAAEQADPDAVTFMTTRRPHRLAVVLAAKLRRVSWPLVVVVWRLCIVRRPGAWSRLAADAGCRTGLDAFAGAAAVSRQSSRSGLLVEAGHSASL